MMDYSRICRNCGGSLGLHHYKTMQCPVGGREAPVGKPQEWADNIFQSEPNEIVRLLADLVGDFPHGVKSNALEAAREYLAEIDAG